MPFIYRLSQQHTLSIKQLRHALQLIVAKHQSLRTSLIFDNEKNLLIQRAPNRDNNKNDMFPITESTYEIDKQLNHIVYDEKRNSRLFDVGKGLVFRCHVVYYKKISATDVMSSKDVLIFNFHHALFDFPSMDVFLHDLNQAYTTGQLTTDNNTPLRYLDYAVIEQQLPMTAANMFWVDTLQDCKIDRVVSLPFDRYRLSDEHRTGRGTSVSFDFGQDLSRHFLAYAFSNNIEPQHLALACHYAFLFKLTNGEKDLCVGMSIDNRYKDELKSMIGMFENIIPLRCQLDPHWSFHQLVEHVREIATGSLEYSYFPLQRILAQNPNASKLAFLDTSFEFYSINNKKNKNEIAIGDSRLHALPMSIKINEDEIMGKFDFILSIQYNSDIDELSCAINASLDLFDAKTVNKIGQRFHSMSRQLFNLADIQTKKSICELSLILPDDRLLMQSVNNTEVSFASVACIHHEFVCQVMKHPQKLAVELDEQSLTYSEVLYHVQLLSLNLLNKQGFVPGDTVCQCVERSLSMVIGMMAIEMAGGVYCPLSPRDPQRRLYLLVEQTQSRFLLVHYLTKNKFENGTIAIDSGAILTNNCVECDIDLDILTSVVVTPESIAYNIFTSGSTGTPKAAQVRHKNFTECMHSLIHIDTFNKNDTIVQMSRCTFDIHVEEVLGTLMSGATLVMLHPRGTIDFEYLSRVLREKQITYMHTVPSLLHNFFTFVQELNNREALKYLRSLCSSGEAFTCKLLDVIINIGIQRCRIWNLYGPAETTIDCTFHLVNAAVDMRSIAIGVPLPNYQCLIFDEFLQNVIINQEGELCVGGVGVFVGYLGRDDLTQTVLVEIDGEIFYRTGDLVRMDNNGFIHYLGRKDHQIKLHGQRIELGEIERCLLDTSISACVVLKWGDDHLVAYVQSSNIDEKQLREHCESHLPPHMVPSLFIILEKLPLNSNGKIDRKQLPPPNFSSLSLSSNEDQYTEPNNVLETQIHSIWCEILQRTRISTNTNFFSIGGHSLLLIQLYHRYKTIFDLDTNTISMAQLTEHFTIADHAQLINHSKARVKRNESSWFLLQFSSENSNRNRSSCSSEIKLYIRCKNIEDLRQDVTINIEQLEKIYLSAIIQDIYIMSIAAPRFNGYNQSRQRLAAVIVSQAHEITVLKELETTSKLKQLQDSQLPWAVLIERESLHITKGSKLTLLEDADREIIENKYRTKIMNILLAHESINDETVDVFSRTMQQQTMMQSRLLIEKDKILDSTLQPFAEKNKKMDNKDIFLTGSTGFLGTYLLDELLKQTDAKIYCLVRSIPSTNTLQSRVSYLYGDLTLPQLGLDDHQYSMVVSKIRSIYHCGAEVNFIKSYTELRPANVLSTLEIIKLSCQANCRINYISTLSVLNRSNQNGYVQSKQVAECLLEQANERGLVVTILRPGFISWSLSTGDFNKTDWVILLLLDLIEFGSAPEIDRTFNMTPVDQMSRCIVELGESEKTIKRTINLPETHTVTFKALWTEICRQRMMEPHYLDATEWRHKLDERIKMDPQSLHALQLFSNALTDPSSQHTTATISTESDLNLPIFIKALLRK